MSYLYPRLPLAVATVLAVERAKLSVFDLVTLSGITHETVRFAPTGGNRISAEELTKLQQSIRICAGQHGYPISLAVNQVDGFDIDCAILLHRSMKLYPSEASHIEMWAFLTIILLPDVVRWRFPGEMTSTERYIGGDRGLRRNTFGRLWWRAYLLNLELNNADDYSLLRQLTEDEIVQITERPSITSTHRLAKAVANAHIHASIDYPHLTRRSLMREGIKRIRRRIPVICYEMLDEKTLQSSVDVEFASAATALTTRLISGDIAPFE